METTELLVDAVDRVRELVHTSLDGLDTVRLAWQPDEGGNSIGWLLWHLTRVQDAHVAEFVGSDQVWVSDGFASDLGFAPDPSDTGYGQSPTEAAGVRISRPDLLLAYHDAVADRSRSRLDGLDASALDRVVDESYDPPVTEGVRWVSIVSDCLQHVGQAAYVRGLLESRDTTAP
jgi:hypothetical protein